MTCYMITLQGHHITERRTITQTFPVPASPDQAKHPQPQEEARPSASSPHPSDSSKKGSPQTADTRLVGMSV